MRYRPTIVPVLTGLLLLASSPAASAAEGWELPALSVPAAHDVSKGEGVTVAVVDTGIRTDHPALRGRATEGPDFLGGKSDRDEPWYGKHGTSMASSVLDVAPEAEVLGLRTLRDEKDPQYQTWEESLKEGGDPEEAAALHQAIRHAVKAGADVVSMSLGSADGAFSPYSESEARAVQYALSKGVVVVASAGNAGDVSRGDGNEVHYPAAYPGVVAVAAATPDGSRAVFSQVHSYNDVAAPGVQIHSADIAGGRSPVQGTSSATALTSGVAALIVAKYPDLAPRQVEEVLQRTASTAEQGHDPRTGYGTVDAAAALQAAAKLTPEKPALPVTEKGAGVHFGPGDDGTPPRTEVGRNPEDTTAAAVIGGPGLVAVVIGVLLAVSGARARRRTSSGPG
ncbi:S8 family serine peptidase [Streptomyces sp. JJ36]|uniref:S8 family peptidase n=1 Tax=Streptomyces sp. JJ36 TaxID=2736645 RepID=UPI001F02A351|nr:S8 family serine peptidase [Streptomyces sp. JJ36]MCF6526471.1 S8 family serine peptidase [Streptomyces sp. JJ36]